jgi:hypothetical protein
VTAGLLTPEEISLCLFKTLKYLEDNGPGEEPGWVPRVATVYAKAGYPAQAMEIARDYAKQLLSGDFSEQAPELALHESSVLRMRSGAFLQAVRQIRPLVKTKEPLKPLSVKQGIKSFGYPQHARLSFRKIPFTEKRDSKRVPIEFPARIIVKGKGHKREVFGAVHHPSTFGLGLQSHEMIPEGATLEIEADTAKLIGVPCRLRGRVNWSRSKVGKQLFMCGIELDRRSKDIKRWRKFILEQLIEIEDKA